MSENQIKIEQILLGLGEIYPQEEVIPKLRYFLEKLSSEDHSKDQLISDFFEVLKVTSEYPVLTDLSQFVEAQNSEDILLNFFKLMEHLSYNPLGRNLKILIKFFELPDSNRESCYNSLILLLEEQSREPSFEYCHHLKEILLEEEAFVKINKILDFFIFLYECPKVVQLKKALDHYLKLDSDLQVWKFLLETLPYPIINRLKAIRAMYPEQDVHEAFSKSQILSKLWLTYELNKIEKKEELKNTIVLCGWYGTLPSLLFKRMGDDCFDRLRSVDIDESCEKLSDSFNKFQKDKSWKYKAITGDIYEMNFDKTQLTMKNNDGESYIEETDFGCIINTSCEHLDQFSQWYEGIPSGKLVILQSNNFFDCEGHVNCMSSLREFKRSAPMSECIYSGELKLDKYTRFMLIGRK